MKIIDFMEALAALFIGMLIFVVLFTSIKRNPTQESDMESKAEYSELFIFDEAKQEQKFTSSKKRKNRYGIQAAAKIRSF